MIAETLLAKSIALTATRLVSSDVIDSIRAWIRAGLVYFVFTGSLVPLVLASVTRDRLVVGTATLAIVLPALLTLYLIEVLIPRWVDLPTRQGWRSRLLRRSGLPPLAYLATLLLYVALLLTVGSGDEYPSVLSKLDSFFSTSAQVVSALLIALFIERGLAHHNDAVDRALQRQGVFLILVGALASVIGVIASLPPAAYAFCFGVALAAVVAAFVNVLLLVASFGEQWAAQRTAE